MVGSEDIFQGSKIKGNKTKEEIVTAMLSLIPSNYTNDDIVFVCIGTDRSTGDSLAPFVGMYLEGLGYKNVYGTIDNPVHAINLKDTIENLPKDKKVNAIDAALGRETSVGNIDIINGSIKPGAGVGKDLISVGDYSVSGVVNVGGFMEYYVLQNTRLSRVIQMAKDITSAIVEVFPLENAKNDTIIAENNVISLENHKNKILVNQ